MTTWPFASCERPAAFWGVPAFHQSENRRAYARSRSLRLGKSSTISCSGAPFRKSDATCCTGIRVPRKTGSPPKTSGEETIRRLPQRKAAKFLAAVCSDVSCPRNCNVLLSTHEVLTAR
jgi:hypothetical protein